jgi:DNA-binding NarL/FixJ family response regulator
VFSGPESAMTSPMPNVAVATSNNVAPVLRRVRALVVHHRDDTRSAISAMLENSNRVDVIAEAKDGIVAMRAAFSQQPELIVADVDTAIMCSIARRDSSIRRRFSATTMIVVCGPNDIHLAESLRAFGAEIYVLQDGFSPEFEARLARLFPT